jgi:hypothetical protein
MNIQDPTALELYALREKRIADVVALRQPDRVPIVFFSTFWAAKYAGMTCQQAMYDFQGHSDALRKAIVELQPDAYMASQGFTSFGPVLDKIGYKQLEWPGDGKMNPDVSYQYIDNEYMLPTEYDEYLNDPTGYLLHKYLPRTATAFEPLAKLPDFPAINYLTLLNSLDAFADPDMRKGLQALMDAGEEMQTLKTGLQGFVGNMIETGYPLFTGAATFSPFDVIVDFMRGAKGGLMDMLRNKAKLLDTIDKQADYLIRETIKSAKKTPSKIVFMPLHWAMDGAMSPKQFETFYWPGLQKVMLALIDADLIPCPLWEGDCTSRLDVIKDIPAGKCIYFFESTDLFKAKKILGDTVCIRGGMPVSTLIQGSVEDVKEQCKKMIDTIGDGGGFIMDASVGIPDEAKPDNVRAMFEFTREYGVYK